MDHHFLSMGIIVDIDPTLITINTFESFREHHDSSLFESRSPQEDCGVST
jgi:hypothetical protein